MQLQPIPQLYEQNNRPLLRMQSQPLYGLQDQQGVRQQRPTGFSLNVISQGVNSFSFFFSSWAFWFGSRIGRPRRLNDGLITALMTWMDRYTTDDIPYLLPGVLGYNSWRQKRGGQRAVWASFFYYYMIYDDFSSLVELGTLLFRYLLSHSQRHGVLGTGTKNTGFFSNT